MKIAYFSFEASPIIGAGHAIRSSVIADALVDAGWVCKVVTSAETYDFIKALSRFERIEPEYFEQNPVKCDLLVVDNYNLDAKYESKFRKHANKILVIDDLANRQHDCDILIDQTYRRTSLDYKKLVSDKCHILTGSEYALIRKDFVKLRAVALEKRQKTHEIKRILVSMGGSDQKNHTLKALDMIRASQFEGDIDIVLGFKSTNLNIVKSYIENIPNNCNIHINADMPNLVLNADLAIGAAGSSVLERCYLGLPQVLMLTADNQNLIYENVIKNIELIFSNLNEAFLALKSIDRSALKYLFTNNENPVERIVSYVVS